MPQQFRIGSFRSLKMITAIETQAIYAKYDIDLTPAEIIEITADANENGENNHRGLNAHQWVLRWIHDELREHMDNSSFSERLEYDFSQN